jgi:hypothetical protein
MVVLSKAHVTTLSLNYFKMIEAMGLKIIGTRSPRMASPGYQTRNDKNMTS